MAYQSFPTTTRRPRVVLTHIEGNLSVHRWEKQEIRIESAEPISGQRQEGDTVMLADYRGDIELWVPAIMRPLFSTTTDIIVNGLSRNAVIEGAGNIELREVGGSATLTDTHGNVELKTINEGAQLNKIGGNLQASTLPHLRVQRHVGGNVWLHAIKQAELDVIGGNLDLEEAEKVTIDIIGGNVEARHIARELRCGKVGGNCVIRQSAEALLIVPTVGGNFTADDARFTESCKVGGNLSARLAPVSTEIQTQLYIGGNATLTLPEKANLRLHIRAGGNVSGPRGPYSRGGGFTQLVYGDGSAELHIYVGGNLKLSGAEPERGDSSESWSEFGHRMGQMGREISREFRKSSW